MSLPTLTYFSSRGLAEILRIVLAEAAVAYEARDLGVFPDLSGLNLLKERGVLPFGSVPLWEEPGGLRLVQSDAILRHLARTHGLYGADPAEAARCDMLHEGTKDVRGQIARLRTADAATLSTLRAELNTVVLPRWLAYFEKLLRANPDSAYFVGAQLTYADLSIWYMIETLTDNELDAALVAFPSLQTFAQRIAGRPNLARHLSDPKRFPPQRLPA